MDIKRAPPHPDLRGVLRAFEERRVELGSAVLTWPVPARPHQIVSFHLAEPYQVRVDGGRAVMMPDTYFVGPQSYRRAQVCLTGEVHDFTVLFQPTGLNRLVGIDMSSLLNHDPAVSDVLGRSGAVLGDAVRAALDFGQRVAVVERWVAGMLEARGPDCVIGRASREIIAHGGGPRIRDLVGESGLSASQFQRRFAVQVGMRPKLFARTTRFDRALSARRDGSNRSWTEIVHDLGYFDQAHFIRECHAFTGLPPGSLIGEWDNIFFPGG